MLRCKVKGGREEVWPLPKDVEEAIDSYLRPDRKRREITHSGGENAPLFQPHTNYRALDFDEPLPTRMVQKIIKRWADYSRLGDLSPHDLRRTAIMRAGVGTLVPAGADDVEAQGLQDRHALRLWAGETWSRMPSTSSAITRNEG